MSSRHIGMMANFASWKPTRLWMHSGQYRPSSPYIFSFFFLIH